MKGSKQGALGFRMGHILRIFFLVSGAWEKKIMVNYAKLRIIE
jgi:hypothetical protein